VSAVLPVEGVIRPYDWGSTTVIQALLGLEPDGRPAAELWFGAHPGSPSPAGASTLDRVVAADPVAILGEACVQRFGPRLPFLLKYLAADRALSMQVHPNLAQARGGFAAEQAAGIPLGARERNYADPNHKPELLCALTPFDALCGFRPVAQTLALLDILALPELDFVAAALRGPDGLRAAFTAILTHAEPAALADAVAARAPTHDALLPAAIAAHDFPGDVGVVLTLLLNHVRLEPGQAAYLGAGNVHAYLRGTGVEIMASSDNVLRCGLTPKHIDVDELVRITEFVELADPVWPSTGSEIERHFAVPVPDFALTRLVLDGSSRLTAPGPQLLLCTAGRIRVGDVDVAPGHAALVPARSVDATVTGSGTVFVATTGG
jgi:mannose-6-phosphate isomerase